MEHAILHSAFRASVFTHPRWKSDTGGRAFEDGFAPSPAFLNIAPPQDHSRIPRETSQDQGAVSSCLVVDCRSRVDDGLDLPGADWRNVERGHLEPSKPSTKIW